MQNRADRIQTLRFTLEAIEEGIGLLVVVKAKRGEIFPFFILTEDIGDEDIILTPLVQGMDQGTADEAGAPGDKD